MASAVARATLKSNCDRNDNDTDTDTQRTTDSASQQRQTNEASNVAQQTPGARCSELAITRRCQLRNTQRQQRNGSGDSDSSSEQWHATRECGADAAREAPSDVSDVVNAESAIEPALACQSGDSGASSAATNIIAAMPQSATRAQIVDELGTHKMTQHQSNKMPTTASDYTLAHDDSDNDDDDDDNNNSLNDTNEKRPKQSQHLHAWNFAKELAAGNGPLVNHLVTQSLVACDSLGQLSSSSADLPVATSKQQVPPSATSNPSTASMTTSPQVPRRKQSVFMRDGFPTNLLLASQQQHQNLSHQQLQQNAEHINKLITQQQQQQQQPKAATSCGPSQPLGSNGSSRASSCDEPPTGALHSTPAAAQSSETMSKGRKVSSASSASSSSLAAANEVEESTTADIASQSASAQASTQASAFETSSTSLEQRTKDKHKEEPAFESLRNKLSASSGFSMPTSQFIGEHIDYVINRNMALIDNWNFVSMRSSCESKNQIAQQTLGHQQPAPRKRWSTSALENPIASSATMSTQHQNQTSANKASNSSKQNAARRKRSYNLALSELAAPQLKVAGEFAQSQVARHPQARAQHQQTNASSLNGHSQLVAATSSGTNILNSSLPTQPTSEQLDALVRRHFNSLVSVATSGLATTTSNIDSVTHTTLKAFQHQQLQPVASSLTASCQPSIPLHQSTSNGPISTGATASSSNPLVAQLAQYSSLSSPATSLQDMLCLPFQGFSAAAAVAAGVAGAAAGPSVAEPMPSDFYLQQQQQQLIASRQLIQPLSLTGEQVTPLALTVQQQAPSCDTNNSDKQSQPSDTPFGKSQQLHSVSAPQSSLSSSSSSTSTSVSTPYQMTQQVAPGTSQQVDHQLGACDINLNQILLLNKLLHRQRELQTELAIRERLAAVDLSRQHAGKQVAPFADYFGVAATGAQHLHQSHSSPLKRLSESGELAADSDEAQRQLLAKLEQDLSARLATTTMATNDATTLSTASTRALATAAVAALATATATALPVPVSWPQAPESTSSNVVVAVTTSDKLNDNTDEQQQRLPLKKRRISEIASSATTTTAQ